MSAPTHSAPSLADQVSAAPVPHDRAAGAEARAALAPPAALAQLVEGAAGCSPFLARAMRREAAWLSSAWDMPLEMLTPEALREAEAARAAGAGDAEIARALRVARRRVALAAALADLGGAWDLDQVCAALSAFADAALRIAADHLLAAAAAAGRPRGLDPGSPGYVLIAMGKLGAGELNYSSDIDLIAVFDEDRFAARDAPEAKAAFVRLTRALVALLSDLDADGYVARVDLRLRPDPGATPLCLSMRSAERYYEAMGRTWERAAHIKARPAAGDMAAGAAYLTRLTPFVWRRHLDFAALQDAAEMLSLLRSHEGGAEIAVAGQDVKLGAGGIREIEFFAQAHQLILGGRAPTHRSPRTRDALRALAAESRIEEETRAELDAAYAHLRMLEHRLQMIDDRQTHRMPPRADADGLLRVARLAGRPDFATLEEETAERMRQVRRAAGPTLDAPPPPDAAAAKGALAAFAEPDRARALVAAWSGGRLRAARSARARAGLERLTPRILTRLGAAADPMRALIQFDRFLHGLPAGAQLFALFEATPWLLDLLTEICAAAPRLSAVLAARPSVLDAVLDRDFFEPTPPRSALLAQLSATCAGARDYELVLDAARRFAAERRFQIGVGLLRQVLTPEEAGRAYSDVAEACLEALWPHVLAEQARRDGPPPGGGAAIVAFGKLGSREMTASSDLDLMIIYAAEPSAASETGAAAAQTYARLAKALITALTAQTSEGALYEVDMRLRPSGNAGPLATALSAFARYQSQDAWTWERMALTRARVVAGDAPARAAAAAAIETALARRNPERDQPEAILAAAREMRARLAEAYPIGRPGADPEIARWAFKHGAGGLIDLEFLAQTGLLIHAAAGAGGARPAEAFARLAEIGAMPRAEAAALADAMRLMTDLQQIERMALEHPITPEDLGPDLRRVLSAAAARPDFDTLVADLDAAQATARASVARRLGG